MGLVQEGGRGEEHLCVSAWVGHQVHSGEKSQACVAVAFLHERIPTYPDQIVSERVWLGVGFDGVYPLPGGPVRILRSAVYVQGLEGTHADHARHYHRWERSPFRVSSVTESLSANPRLVYSVSVLVHGLWR